MIALSRARRLAPMVGLMAVGLALFCARGAAAAEPEHSAELDAMIVRQAKRHGVPETLVRRIVMRESRYNPRARNHSFWGLMQISYPTAKSMGFKGSPTELLNPVVNLTYAVPYLANAFIVAGKREDAAIRLYAKGYYAAARSRGLLSALRTAESAPLSGDAGGDLLLASADPASQQPPAPDYGPFGALFAPTPEPVATPSVPLAALPDGKPTTGESAELVPGRDGIAAPPRKWARDGGVTTVARGEQRIEQVAAYSHATDDARSAAGSRRSRRAKTTTFAALELPANGQAYAATPDAQASSLAQAAPQAAITQATSFQGNSGAAAAGQHVDAVPNAPASADADLLAPRAKQERTRPRHHVANKVARAKEGRTQDPRTAAAQSPEPEQPAPAAPAPQEAQ